MYTINVKDIPNKFSCIYKINYPNGKIYIGQTCNLKRRINEHNNFSKAAQPCDLAIKKYGKIIEVEILEEINDLSIINEKEIYWINKFCSNNRNIGYNLTIGGNSLKGEDAPISKFTNSEVLLIRKSRYEGKKKINIYNKYFSDRSFGTFESIWLGRGYDQIGVEYFIPTNSISKQIYSSIANSGENNNKAKLTKNDVILIRERFDSGETYSEIHKDYSFVKLITIKRVCNRETWKNI